MSADRQRERAKQRAHAAINLAVKREDLAAAAGISVGTVTRLERNASKPVSPTTVRKLATALKVPVTTLTRCGPQEA